MKSNRGTGHRRVLLGAAAALSLVLGANPAAAQEEGFRNSIEAYLMGVSMSGTVGMGPLGTDIDVPPSTIFENLKFAALVDYRGEAPRWAVAADLVYMKIGAAGTGDRGVASADVGVEEFVFDLVGAYRFSSSFEAIAGARYTGLRTTVALTTPRTYREATVSKGWIDPVVGAQAFLPLSRAVQLQLRGDIGGFGVGCSFTWSALARVNWQVSRTVRLGLGYRWLDQDYETGSGSDYFRWKVLTQGPLVAAGVTF